MKRCVTQRLFWKKWPYKVILDFSSGYTDVNSVAPKFSYARWTRSRRDINPDYMNLRRWHKKNLEDTGLRSEGGCVSLFLATQEQVDLVVETWTRHIKEVWEPKDDSSLKTMQDHVFDIVREHPWYRRFPIRARLLYTKEFRDKGLPAIQQAVSGMEPENWYAAGALKILLDNSPKEPWPYGQPYYLYLAENEDAIMLKLQVGDWIDRFERQRKP